MLVRATCERKDSRKLHRPRPNAPKKKVHAYRSASVQCALHPTDGAGHLDMHGTLVTNAKVLTQRHIDAVAKLREAGIRFVITKWRATKGRQGARRCASSERTEAAT